MDEVEFQKRSLNFGYTRKDKIQMFNVRMFSNVLILHTVQYEHFKMFQIYHTYHAYKH